MKNMNFLEAVEEVEKIIKIPDPGLIHKSEEHQNWGYKAKLSDPVWKGKTAYYFHTFMLGGTTLENVKKDAKLDIARLLLFGAYVEKDSVFFPKIEMTEEQYQKIRKLGKKIIKDN